MPNCKLYLDNAPNASDRSTYFARADRKPIVAPLASASRAELIERYAMAHSRYLVDVSTGAGVRLDESGALVDVPSLPRGLCASAGKLVRQLVTCGFYSERSSAWVARAAYFAERGQAAGLSVHLVQLCVATGRSASRGAVCPI